MTQNKVIKSTNLIEDVIQITKYLLWDTDIGNTKAQNVINDIHAGKYGSREGIWPQVEKAINIIKANLEVK